jgi:hypothetical protein
MRDFFSSSRRKWQNKRKRIKEKKREIHQIATVQLYKNSQIRETIPYDRQTLMIVGLESDGCGSLRTMVVRSRQAPHFGGWDKPAIRGCVFNVSIRFCTFFFLRFFGYPLHTYYGLDFSIKYMMQYQKKIPKTILATIFFPFLFSHFVFTYFVSFSLISSV